MCRTVYTGGFRRHFDQKVSRDERTRARIRFGERERFFVCDVVYRTRFTCDFFLFCLSIRDRHIIYTCPFRRRILLYVMAIRTWEHTYIHIYLNRKKKTRLLLKQLSQSDRTERMTNVITTTLTEWWSDRTTTTTTTTDFQQLHGDGRYYYGERKIRNYTLYSYVIYSKLFPFWSAISRTIT